jgi:curved DNA-binding protein CbpA
MDLYETLGVPRDATDGEISRAFRHKAKTCHPDVALPTDASGRQFERITLARDILSDPERRRRYDATGDISPDRADNAAAMAAQTALNAIEAALDKVGSEYGDERYEDLIAMALRSLEDQMADIRKQQAGFTSKVARYEAVIGRIKPKNGAGGMLPSMLAAQLAKIREHVGEGDRHLDRLTAACEEIGRYRYEVEARPEQVMTWDARAL